MPDTSLGLRPKADSRAIAMSLFHVERVWRVELVERVDLDLDLDLLAVVDFLVVLLVDFGALDFVVLSAIYITVPYLE